MTILQSILLGIIQGLTEFIPISSSAHLVIIPYIFNWDIREENAFIFNVIIQVASLFALFIYFRNQLIEILLDCLRSLLKRNLFETHSSKLGWLIIVATIPSVLIGLALKRQFENSFTLPIQAGLFLFVTAGLLILAEKFSKINRNINSLNWIDALMIGFFQVLALFPGISRSGATITGGMLKHINRADAARFSFLMSVPALLGAGIIATLDLFQMSHQYDLIKIIIPGFVSSLITSYIAIYWLIKYLNRNSLIIFSIYCIIFGSITMVFALFR